MARLRIRIELNRGGVGVPLHKLASVVDEAQKFFHLLTEDVQIDQSNGSCPDSHLLNRAFGSRLLWRHMSCAI